MAVPKSLQIFLPKACYSEPITLVCMPKVKGKWKAMLESHFKTSMDWTIFKDNLQFLNLRFFIHQLHKITIYWVTYQQPSARSQAQRYVLYFKFSEPEADKLLNLNEHWEKLCEERIFQLQFMSKAIICIEKALLSRILVYYVWPWYSTWAMLEWRSWT